MDFLITGLPRSRTAWLAALMTAQGSPCAHEPDIFIPGWKAIRELDECGFKGISDPSCYMRYKEKLSHFIGKPILIIDRKIDQCEKSFAKWLNLDHFDLKPFKTALDLFCNSIDHIKVSFEDLDNKDVVSSIVKYLNGSVLSNHMWEIFNHLEINQHKQKAVKSQW